MSLVAVSGAAASVEVAATAHGAHRQVVGTAHRGGRPSDVTPIHAVPSWTTWRTDRVFDAKPGSAFFAALPSGATLLASGTTPDGMDFRLTYDAAGDFVEQTTGVHDRDLWGDGGSASSYGLDRPFFASELMTKATWDHNREDGAAGFWLIVIGQPGTTSAEVAIDGTDWKSMQVQDGIAVAKVGTPEAGIPPAARLRLADDAGLYFDGAVNAA
jgi:YD repeat-containing protein